MGKTARNLRTIGAEPLALIGGATIRADFQRRLTHNAASLDIDVDLRSIRMLEGLPASFTWCRFGGFESSTFECFEDIGG